jgi:hypothetical protein
MRLYEDLSLEDALIFAQEVKNKLNLKWWEQRLENLLRP